MDTTSITPFLFHPQPKLVEQPAAKKKQVMTNKYSVRVALFSGVAAGTVGSEDLLSKLKIVLLKRANDKGALGLIGGAWSPELDGDGSSATPISVVRAHLRLLHCINRICYSGLPTEHPGLD